MCNDGHVATVESAKTGDVLTIKGILDVGHKGDVKIQSHNLRSTVAVSLCRIKEHSDVSRYRNMQAYNSSKYVPLFHKTCYTDQYDTTKALIIV